MQTEYGTSHRFLASLVLAGSLAITCAAPHAAPLTDAQRQLLAAADPAQDEAAAGKCTKCHGEGGVSDDDEVPHLAGQAAGYLFKQLLDFKTDAREGGRMNKTARKLDEQAMAGLAARYAGTALPTMTSQQAPAAPLLVAEGDAARGVKPCAECHGTDGRGKKDKYDTPALAGMPATYFTATMHAFRDGTRANDPDHVMRDAAKALSDAELTALADYYLALGQRLRQPAP